MATVGTSGVATIEPYRRLRPSDYLFSLGVAYFLILGGTDLGLVTAFRAINAALGAALIVVWVAQLRKGSDRTDVLIVFALLCFEIAAAMSMLPGMSTASAVAVLAYTALFGVARRRVADPRGRRALVATLAVVGGFFVVFFLIGWVPHWVAWMTVYGPQIPPLDLDLPAFTIYNYKYMVAIFVAMLVPAFFMLWPSHRGMPAKVLLTAGAGLLIVMSGSRSAWLAVFTVLLGLAVTRWRPRTSLPRLLLASAAVTVVVIIGWVSGLEQAFAHRLFVESTISLRFQVWGDALAQFAARPLSGAGPGTFATTITQSGLFNTVREIGRGPDGSAVQLLSETGLVGVVGITLAAIGLALGIMRAQSRDAVWAIAGAGVFVVSSLTNDTVTSAQHIALLVIWAALAAPLLVTTSTPSFKSWRQTVVRAGTAMALVLIGMGMLATLVAAHLFDLGAEAGRLGQPAQALSYINLATRIDPSQGVYWREAGFYDFLLGQHRIAGEELARASRLLPGDATTLRITALNDLAAGDPRDALDAASAAVDLRRSDEINLETAAYVASQAHDRPAETAALVALLQDQPWLAASPTWRGIFPTGSRLTRLFEVAQSTAKQSEPNGRQTPARTWLAAITGDTEVGNTPALLGLSAWLRCDIQTAVADAQSSWTTRSYDRWIIVGDVMVFRSTGQAGRADDVLRRGAFGPDGPAAHWGLYPTPATDPTIDPAEDLRMYGMKLGMRHPATILLPGHAEALSSWMMDPISAVKNGAPGSAAASCPSLQGGS